MNERELLKKGTRISLKNYYDDGIKAIFEISDYVGEGASAVCYKAILNGTIGFLKEIYRGDDFVNVYEILQDIKLEDKENEVLNNYIPYMELYKCDEKVHQYTDPDENTIFSWTPEGMTGENLSQFYDKCYSDKDDLELKLYKIINLMISITECTRALHKGGILALDIKPSNFQIPYNSNNEINENIVSMYDIDSFILIGTKSKGMLSGTKGYSAPEVERGYVDNRADIYSIGATLYKGIVWDKNITPYTRDKYDFIDDYVKNSPYIKDSEYSNNDYLIYYLIKILRNCLAFSRNRRYDCCEDLLEDLNHARACMLPYVERKNINPERVLKLEMAEKDLSPTSILQNMLYTDPLFKYADTDTNDINVLIIGEGVYSSRFMDLSLQAGQMAGYNINITQLTNEPSFTEQVYLGLRPGMKDFVRINGKFLRNDQTPYGKINFEGFDHVSKIPSDLKVADLTKTADFILNNYILSNKISYIFIATGSDETNRLLATLISNGIDINYFDNRIPVYYVNLKGENERTGESPYEPTNVNSKFDKEMDINLEQKAFNVHLKWMEDKNPDYYEARELFNNRYNHDASVDFALSIKYKLFGLGIDDEIDDKEKYDLICKKVEENPVLVHAEHRRWVMQKVCDGWMGFESKDGKFDFSECVMEGATKLNSVNRHPCIVFDSPTNPLADFTKEMWDNEGDYDDGLDELDQVSVGLHRAFGKNASMIRNQHLAGEYEVYEALKIAVDSDSNIMMPKKKIKEFYSCVENIITNFDNGDKLGDSCSKFDILFKEVFVKCTEETKILANQIAKDIFSMKQFSYYINYKEYDKQLILQIPFILTNVPKPYDPKPIDTSDVVLDDKMEELLEILAENSHDIWSKRRMEEGWDYGIERDNNKKTNPDIMPYNRLPESEKEYDRENARQFLKVLIKLGYL